MLRGTLRLCGAAVTGAVAYWHAVPACEEGKGRTTRVEADILIPGRGPPINNGVVVGGVLS